MDRRHFLLTGIGGLIATSVPAATARMRARGFIITNSYAQAPSVGYLANTRADGLLIEERLRALKFQSVDRVEDADEVQLKERLARFRALLSPGELAFIYIAAHGVQLDSENFLLLGDGTTFLSMLSIIDSVRQATGFIVLMLDACRNRPFEEVPPGLRIARAVGAGGGKKSGTLDLNVTTLDRAPAEVSTVKAFQIRGTGVKVVFATDPQNVAYDAADPSQTNSPFAIAISKRLAERRSLDDAVALATGDVIKSTDGAQSPWSQGSIGQPIFLAGPPEKTNPAKLPFQVPG